MDPDRPTLVVEGVGEIHRVVVFRVQFWGAPYTNFGNDPGLYIGYLGISPLASLEPDHQSATSWLLLTHLMMPGTL